MTYAPTPGEARLWLASLAGFWLSSLAASLADYWFAVVPGLALIFVVYTVQSRVVSRATGVPVSLFRPRSPFRRREPEETQAYLDATFAVMKRAWWRAVLAAARQ